MNTSASIGLISSMWRLILAVGSQLQQCCTRRRQAFSHRELSTQCLELIQVKIKDTAALMLGGCFQCVCIDFGVAVAITTNPAAHTQKQRIGKRLFVSGLWAQC